MRLYHGTTERYLDEILKYGLLPRSRTQLKGNFLAHPSHEDCVYLSNCYAPYFAGVASNFKDKWVIVEVDVAEDNLLPDEDFLEQATRPKVSRLSIAQRTEKFKKSLHDYAHLALESLKHLGTAAVDVDVDLSNITRVAKFDSSKNRYIASMAMDPSISLINHQILGGRYEALTKWFFDPGVSAQDMDAIMWAVLPDEHKKQCELHVKDRSGVEILAF